MSVPGGGGPALRVVFGFGFARGALEGGDGSLPAVVLEGTVPGVGGKGAHAASIASRPTPNQTS
jgi:hypothetical protein